MDTVRSDLVCISTPDDRLISTYDNCRNFKIYGGRRAPKCVVMILYLFSLIIVVLVYCVLSIVVILINIILVMCDID